MGWADVCYRLFLQVECQIVDMVPVQPPQSFNNQHTWSTCLCCAALGFPTVNSNHLLGTVSTCVDAVNQLLPLEFITWFIFSILVEESCAVSLEFTVFQNAQFPARWVQAQLGYCREALQVRGDSSQKKGRGRFVCCHGRLLCSQWHLKILQDMGLLSGTSWDNLQWGIFQLAMLDYRRVAVLVMFEGMFDKCLMQLVGYWRQVFDMSLPMKIPNNLC